MISAWCWRFSTWSTAWASAGPVDVPLDVLDLSLHVGLEGFGGLEVPEGDVHLHGRLLGACWVR